MATFTLRCALDDHGGKWPAGTILGAYPIDAVIGPAELGGYLLIKVTGPTLTIDYLRGLRGVKRIDLDVFLDEASKAAFISQKAMIVSKARANQEVLETDLVITPDLVRVFVWSAITLLDVS